MAGKSHEFASKISRESFGAIARTPLARSKRVSPVIAHGIKCRAARDSVSYPRRRTVLWNRHVEGAVGFYERSHDAV